MDGRLGPEGAASPGTSRTDVTGSAAFPPNLPSAPPLSPPTPRWLTPQGISTRGMPRQYTNRNILESVNEEIFCEEEPVVEVSVPVTERAPTQEFNPSWGGRRLMGDEYDDELRNVRAPPARNNP
eukprot:1180003-Prorocentrum_minimum.AAC.4